MATLLLGLVAGAAMVATLGLSIVIDNRAALLDPTSAVAAQNVADLFRGTPLPTAKPLATTLTAKVVPSPTLDTTPTVSTTTVSIYSRVPGRLRKLPNGRRMDWFIDNDMDGLHLDPPIDSELGRKIWTKLDYSDDSDYGSGYVTVIAGETVSVVWTMDVALPVGYYEIFAYRPSYLRNFVAESVQYHVRLGNTELRPFTGTNYVNQQTALGMWVSIGGYEIRQPDVLSISLDVEGARPVPYEVDVDAIGIVQLSDKKLASQ
jgi:hypothetical protein